MTTARTFAEAGSGVWRWVRAHWLDLMLPALAFLLAAGIYRQVTWLTEGRRFQEAQRHYRAALQAEEKGDRRTALGEALAAARAAPDSPGLQMGLTVLLRRLERPVEAARLMERALGAQESPGQAQYLGVVHTWYEAGRDEDAERLLREQVLARWPDSAEGAFLEGLVRLRREPGGQGLRRAAASFERALRHDPDHAGALFRYGVCLNQLDRPAEAERVLRKALRRTPSLPAAHHALADALRKQGKTDEARQVLAEFRRIDDAQRQVRHLETRQTLKQATASDLLELGTLDLALNRTRQAEAALLEYLVREPTDPRGHRRLAEVYRRARRPEKARAEERLAAALEAQGRGGR